MLVQHRILHPSFFSLPKREISLPKVIIIVDTMKPLSFKTLTACLYPCCSWSGPGTGKCGWKSSTLQPSSMQGHGDGLRRARSICLKQEEHFLQSSPLTDSAASPGQERGWWGQQGQCRAGPCPCCCHLVLLLPSHLLGSRTEALIYYT